MRRSVDPVRRHPENSLLSQIASGHLDDSLARAAELTGSRGLPPFVKRELPHVPVRQWVFTLPIPLRFLIAFDREAGRRVRNICVRAVLGFLKRRAIRGGLALPNVGAVTAVQRFGSALNLNVHLHILALDGVYPFDPSHDEPRFLPIGPPSPQELETLLKTVRARVLDLPRRRGLLARDPAGVEETWLLGSGEGQDSPPLAACAGGSILHRVALGEGSVRSIPRRRSHERAIQSSFPKEGCVAIDGFSLHSNVRVAARDRGRLERLCRHLTRPPVSDDRRSLAEDGRILLELKTPWNDGTTQLALDPMTLLERLASLVPPPHAHLVVHHGVLSSAAALRPHVVATARAGESVERTTAGTSTATPSDTSVVIHRRSYTWAELMKRVFLIDVLRCPCGGARRLIAPITDPAVIARILRHLGLDDLRSSRGPPDFASRVAPPRPASESREVRLVPE